MRLQEIKEEIEHRNNIISALRRRNRDRELQAARYGIDTPPYIIEEITTTNQQILEHENELIQLRSELTRLNSNINHPQSTSSSQKRMNKNIIIIASVFAFIFITAIVLMLLKNTSPNTTATPTENTNTILPKSNTEQSEISQTYPEEFIKTYYNILISREYDTAWSMLSDDFKKRYHCCSSDGSYDKHGYTSYWNTIQNVNILDVSKTKNEDNQYKYFAKLYFTRDDGSTVTQELYIYLSKKSS